LARLIQARQEDLSQGAAEYLLSIQFDERDIERMNTLSELAREGKLSPAIGGVTISVLFVNDPEAVVLGKSLREEGVLPL
jgi:hypothetical protein